MQDPDKSNQNLEQRVDYNRDLIEHLMQEVQNLYRRAEGWPIQPPPEYEDPKNDRDDDDKD